MKITQYTNKNNYGLSIAAWLGDSDYNHTPVEGPYISVTSLLKPMRMIVLDQRKKQILRESDVIEEIDIDNFVASRLGSALHSAIEHSWLRSAGKFKAYVLTLIKLGYSREVVEALRVNPTKDQLEADPNIIPVYMEQRAFKKVLGWTVGGMYDFIGDGVLEDFKSMGAWGFMQGDKDQDQLLQGSMYRWLNPDLIKADWMRIQQIITDWSKLEALKGIAKGYPQLRIVEKELPLMSIKETDAWVKGKLTEINSYKDTPEEELPKCTEKELWQKPPTFAYYGMTKDGTLGKRATRVFDKPEEAFAMLKKKGKGEVIERGAIIKRCGYCDARDLCSDFAEYERQGIIQMP